MLQARVTRYMNMTPKTYRDINKVGEFIEKPTTPNQKAVRDYTQRSFQKIDRN